jgi:hypothetical protein
MVADEIADGVTKTATFLPWRSFIGHSVTGLTVLFVTVPTPEGSGFIRRGRHVVAGARSSQMRQDQIGLLQTQYMGINRFL